MQTTSKKLNSVLVIFENTKYNYETNVSTVSNEKDCREYFVNRFFDVGIFPEEKLLKCIDIKFTDNNL